MEFQTPTLRFKHVTDPCPEAGMFSRHAQNHYEFIYFLRGNTQFIVGEQHHRLKAGELIVIPPAYYHFIKIEESAPYERAVILFLDCDVRKELLDWVFSAPRILDLNEEPALRAVFQRMEEYASFEPVERDLLSRNLLSELICLLSRREMKDQPFAPYFSDTITAAVQYIEENLTTITSTEEIHEALFISRAQLYRSFRAAFGIPPMKYVTEKRLVLADAKIQVGEKPAQAAAACGFGDYSAFYRAYKKRFGKSPNH